MELEGEGLCFQFDISVLPGCSKENLATLQEQDSVIGPLLVCWGETQPPDSKERERFGQGTKELARQWGCLRRDYTAGSVPLMVVRRLINCPSIYIKMFSLSCMIIMGIGSHLRRRTAMYDSGWMQGDSAGIRSKRIK